MLSRGGALTLALALGLAGCGRLPVPAIGMPGATNQATAKLFENRVWIDEDPDAPAGSLRAFLTDGTLVMTSCTETYRLAPWRWVDEATLVWEEDGRNLRAEVAMVEKTAMVLVIDLGEETLTQRFRAAQSPVVCPDLPR